MKNFSFTLPLPPSDNSLYANRRKKVPGRRGRILTQTAAAWKEEASLMLLSQGVRQEPNGLFFGLDTTVVLSASGRRPDLCNCYKALIDTIAEMITIDDKFLVEDLRRLELSDEREPFVWGEIRVWYTLDGARQFPLRGNCLIPGKAKGYDL